MSCKASVLPSSDTQLTGTLRTQMLTAALIFGSTSAGTQFRTQSSSNHLAFKKAKILAGSQKTLQQSNTSILTDLQKLGCGN